MKKYLEILKSCPLFEGVEEGELLSMLHCLDARVDVYDKKYTVMTEGAPATYIGVVLSGAVQIVQLDYYGNRSILSEVGAGGLFAEAFACAGVEALPVSVIASEPSEIMLLRCHCILHTCSKHCSHHQALIFNLMRDLANKSLQFHQRIEITSRRTTREKLLAYLNVRARETGSASFDIPFDRQELADYLEVDRSGLSAEISKLRAEGVLESHRRHFVLL